MKESGFLAWLLEVQRRLSEWLAIAGMLVITALILFVVSDVVMRSLFNAPLKGTVDYVSTGIGMAIALVMPYGFLADKHISVPIFADALPGAARRVVGLLAVAVSTAFFAALTWQSILYAIERYEGGDRMMIVGWSTWPAWVLIALFFVVTTIALVTLLAVYLLGGSSSAADAPDTRDVARADSRERT